MWEHGQHSTMYIIHIPKKCCPIAASIALSVVSETTAGFSRCSLAVLVAGRRLGGDDIFGRFLASGIEAFCVCELDPVICG